MTLTFRPDFGGIVADPRFWASAGGYEFWFNVGNVDLVTAMAAANDGLSGYGWTVGTATVTEGSAGDFLSSADIDPTRLVISTAGQAVRSPRVFGSYDHGLLASRFLGGIPTKLSVEFYARFSVATAAETTSFIGLHTPAGVDAALAGCAGAIRSGGTASTFFLTSDLGSDAGAAIDTLWHKWRIEYGATTTEWFMDDVSQGTITTELDIWPQSFCVVAGTTNRPELAWVRIFYS